jgi:hypothetical protein
VLQTHGVNACDLASQSDDDPTLHGKRLRFGAPVLLNGTPNSSVVVPLCRNGTPNKPQALVYVRSPYVFR